MTMNWSEYQEAIFDAVERIHEGGRDLVVLARAGTGKTTTMVEAVIRYARRNPRNRTLTCAFNVKNAKDLQNKIGAAGLDWRTASAKTLNSVGLATVRKAWGKGVEVDPEKGKKAAKAACVALPAVALEVISPEGKVRRLATLAKITLTDPKDLRGIEELANRYAVADEAGELAALARLASRAMELSADDRSSVDFDDQLWFPHFFGLSPWKHDLVVVDEAQDMNPAQLELARNSVKAGGRLVAVGDDRQAIYGWRAADSDFLTRMIRDLGAVTLPLPRTYRCATSIVSEAKRIVPDYEAAAGNEPGTVRAVAVGKLLAEVEPGDFVLCRSNAPLLPICLELLKDRVPAAIQGRDVLGQLLGVLRKAEERDGVATTAALVGWLESYEADERRKLEEKDADEGLFELLSDRCACLRALLDVASTLPDLRARLEELFSDVDDDSRVTLSTAHRAKGLERDRVFLLWDSFREGGQESNCLYVAITRARRELVYVQS